MLPRNRRSFWDDNKAAEIQMRKVKAIRLWIDLYNDVVKAVEEVQLAFDFFKDEAVSEEEVDTERVRCITKQAVC